MADAADEHAFARTLRDSLAKASESVWLWAPWSPGRLGKVLPLLRDARSRGVRVTVFAPGPDDERMARPAAQAWAAELGAAATRVVRWHGLHQELLVIDGRIAWLGGLNTLSERRTRAVLVRYDGPLFSTFLLDDGQAKLLGVPPACPVCARAHMELVRSGLAPAALAWRCASSACPGRVELAHEPPRSIRNRQGRRGR